MFNVQLMPICDVKLKTSKYNLPVSNTIEPENKAINANPHILLNAFQAYHFSNKPVAFCSLRNAIIEDDIAEEIEYELEKSQSDDWDCNIYDVHSVSAYLEAIKTNGFKTKKIIAVGGESIVFELEDGNILKLSARYNYSDNNPKLYAPEIDRGEILMEEPHYLADGFPIDYVSYVIQKKGDINVDPADISDFIENQVEPLGYKVSDYNYDQFAYFKDEDGKKIVRAVDLRCISKGFDRNIFENMIEAADMPECYDRNCIIRDVLIDKIYGKSFDVTEHHFLVKNMVIKINKEVKNGVSLMDATNSVLQENGKEPLKTF